MKPPQNGDMLQKTLTTAFSSKQKIGILTESSLKVVSNSPNDNKLVLVETSAWYDKTLFQQMMARLAAAYVCNQPCVNDYL